jgi:hypothetical protein
MPVNVEDFFGGESPNLTHFLPHAPSISLLPRRCLAQQGLPTLRTSQGGRVEVEDFAELNPYNYRGYPKLGQQRQLTLGFMKNAARLPIDDASPGKFP